MNYSKALAICGASLVAAAAIGVTAFPVHAQHPPRAIVVNHNLDDYVTERVTYADLNLAYAPGQRTLNGRVGYAVNNVCYEAVPYGDTNSVAYRDCTNGAWHRARPQIASAVQRATEIAATGTSSIVAAAITIDISK